MINVRFFVISLLFCVQQISFTQAQSFIPDKASIEALTSIMTENRELLDGLPRNQDPYFKEEQMRQMLERQFDLQTQLSQRSDFTDFLDEFRDLEEYGISTTSTGKKNQYSVNGHEFVKAHRQNPIYSFSKARLIQFITNLLEELDKKGPEGIRIGVISALPKDIKASLLKNESLGTQLEKLSEIKIDNEAFDESFLYEKHDLGGKPQKFESLLQEIDERSKQVEHLIFALVCLNKPNNTYNEGEAAQFLDEVINYSKDDLLKFLDGNDLDLNIKSMMGLLSWFKRLHAMKVSVDTKENVAEFKMVELPMYLALFRGCFGGDCSTSSSWAFPNSPLEKDFYVVSKGRVTGYVSTTIIEIDGKRMLLIKDLQGPNISSKQAEQILDFLHFTYSKKHKTEGLAITKQSFIQSNNNYQILKQVLFDAIQRGPEPQKTDFIDSVVRDYFGQVSSKSYDSPSVHKEATIFIPQTPESRLQISKKPSSYDFLNLDKEELYRRHFKFDKELAIRIIFENLSADDIELSSREAGFIRSIESGFSDIQVQSVVQFSIQINEYMSQFLEPEEIEKLKEKRPDIFIKSRLSIPDALTTTNMEEFVRTHEQLFWVFENGDINTYINLFSSKIQVEPDIWFIEKIRQIFSENKEEIFNTALHLYGNGLHFLEGNDHQKVLSYIQAELGEQFGKTDPEYTFISSQLIQKLQSDLNSLTGHYNRRAFAEVLKLVDEMLAPFGLNFESIESYDGLISKATETLFNSNEFEVGGDPNQMLSLLERIDKKIVGIAFTSYFKNSHFVTNFTKCAQSQTEFCNNKGRAWSYNNGLNRLIHLFEHLKSFVDESAFEIFTEENITKYQPNADSLVLILMIDNVKVETSFIQETIDILWEPNEVYQMQQAIRSTHFLVNYSSKIVLPGKAVIKFGNNLGKGNYSGDNGKMIIEILEKTHLEPNYSDNSVNMFKRFVNRTIKDESVEKLYKLRVLRAWAKLKGRKLSKKTLNTDYKIIKVSRLSKEERAIYNDIEQMRVQAEKAPPLCNSILK